MRLNKIYNTLIVIILFIITIQSALADTFQNNVSITIDNINHNVIVNYESGTQSYPIVNNQSINHNITYQIERLVNNTLIIDYEKIQNLNHEDLVQEFANQQSYIRETFLPAITEIETIKAENDQLNVKLNFCTDVTEDLKRANSFMNASKTEYTISVEKQNSTLSIMLGGIMLIIISLIFYALFETKIRRGGRL